MHSSYPHSRRQQQIYYSWPSTPTLLAARVLENTTQAEKDFNVVSSKQFRRGGFLPPGTNVSVVQLHIKGGRNFFTFAFGRGGVLSRYFQGEGEHQCDPTGEGVLGLTDRELFPQLG